MKQQSTPGTDSTACRPRAQQQQQRQRQRQQQASRRACLVKSILACQLLASPAYGFTHTPCQPGWSGTVPHLMGQEMLRLPVGVAGEG